MDRTAVITGGAGTIGLAAAEALLNAGDRVVLVDHDQNGLLECTKRLAGKSFETFAVDISNPAAGVAIAEAVRSRNWSPVTILVNNAGIAPRPNGKTASVLEISRETWQVTFDVNVTAPLFLCQHFLPGMRDGRWGRIINISSAAARFKPLNAGPAYVASKAALLGLTKSIASAYGVDGVTCNAIAPGLIPTKLSREIPAERMAEIVAGTALRRPGRPEEVGETIAFLASDAAGYISGACIDVNGGAGMI